MTLALQFLFLGLGNGAVYAALALAVVVSFRSTGVVNFAYGAIMAYPAYAFYNLRTQGILTLPLVGVPSNVTITDGPMSLWPAFVIAVAMTALIGLLCHYLVFRPLRNAPALSKVVASVGIMIVLQAIVVIRFGVTPINAPNVLPAGSWNVFGVLVPQDSLYLAGIVLLCALFFFLVFRFTPFGRRTRAAIESEKGAVLLGYSPDRIAAVNAVIASTLVGILGVLVGSVTASNTGTFSLLIIPALGAALVGRFTSFGAAAIAALAIGMLQAEIVHFNAIWAWFPQNMADTLPFLVIVFAMVALGKRIPGRGVLTESRLPAALRSSRPYLLGGIGAIFALVLIMTLTGSYLISLSESIIYVPICLSVVVLTGFVGQISLAPMAWAGAAAYLFSELARNLSWQVIPSIIISVLAAIAAGAIVGVPALRVRGTNLAVVTLALGWAVENYVFDSNRYSATGGAAIGELNLFGWNAGTGRMFAVLCLVVSILVGIGVQLLRRSRLGLQMLSVRANERAAAAIGISPARIKLTAFAIASGLAGLGGVLLGFQQGTVDGTTFDVFVSLGLVASVYLGGISTVTGGVLGALLATDGLVYYILTRIVGSGEIVLLISGLGLILTTILNPEGIVGAMRDTVRAVKSRRQPPDRVEVGQSVPGGASVREADVLS